MEGIKFLIGLLYGTAILTTASLVVRDWRKPGEDRFVIVVTAAVFAVVYVILGVAFAKLGWL